MEQFIKEQDPTYNCIIKLEQSYTCLLYTSIAITADALNNLSDASSNIVSLVGFKLAAKAPDAEHPYGHALSLIHISRLSGNAAFRQGSLL